MRAPFARNAGVAILCLALFAPQSVAFANSDDDSCLPGIVPAFFSTPAYGRLLGVLLLHQGSLKTLLDAVDDQASYQTLLVKAESVAAVVENGRVVVTLQDGTVVLDTAVADDPTNSLPEGNSFQHFQDKTVNENHNTRVAILSAQQYPCGVGLERKLSTSTGDAETYFALRLGRHLNSSGTVRLSIGQ